MPDLTVGLYDTETDTLITTLDDGATIPASLLTDTTTFVVIVDPSSVLVGRFRSALLELTDGETTYSRRDNKGPYSLFGDDNRGDYYDGIELLAGEYQFVVEFYSRIRLLGCRDRCLGHESEPIPVQRRMW